MHCSLTMFQNHAFPCQDATHQNHFTGNIRSLILFILVVTLTPNVHRLGLVVSVNDLVHWSVGQ